jgi:hypothetical protein
MESLFVGAVISLVDFDTVTLVLAMLDIISNVNFTFLPRCTHVLALDSLRRWNFRQFSYTGTNFE